MKRIDPMNIILIHVGDQIPPHIFKNIEQIRRLYDGNLFVILDNQVLKKHKEYFYKYNCSLIPTEELDEYENCLEFKKVSPILQEPFWTTTFQRLFLLESTVAMFDLKNVLHFENDILIYENPEDLQETFKHEFSQSVAIMPSGPMHSSAALLYTQDLSHLRFLNLQCLQLMNQCLRDPELKKTLYGNMITEMSVLFPLQMKYPDKIRYLPILPDGQFSDGLEKFNMLFDPNGWGQYVGGVDRQDSMGPGTATPWTYVGQELLQKKYDIVWEYEKGMKKPRVVNTSNGDRWKLFNLHVHRKNLQDYM